MRLAFTLLLAGIAVLAAVPAASAAPDPPRVGQQHPNFTLPRIDNGRPVSLSDFRGKKVLLIQFASW
jgi:cytochrome oxidase Cu insertion factor (SCO1/SenC/PrrC family)